MLEERSGERSMTLSRCFRDIVAKLWRRGWKRNRDEFVCGPGKVCLVVSSSRPRIPADDFRRSPDPLTGFSYISTPGRDLL